MPSSVNLTADTLDVKTRFNKFGNELSFVIDVHFESKKFLKKLSFLFKISSKLVIYIQ